jgi:hypothetical protein
MKGKKKLQSLFILEITSKSSLLIATILKGRHESAGKGQQQNIPYKNETI